jgi:hypothetical protein
MSSPVSEIPSSSTGRSWKFVLISLASIVLGLPPALMFSTPTALGFVQLPGVIITFGVACCSVLCFLLCSRRPIAPKLTCLVLAILPLWITLDLVKDYYLHITYER